MTVLYTIGAHLLAKQNAGSGARVPLDHINVTATRSDFLPKKDERHYHPAPPPPPITP